MFPVGVRKRSAPGSRQLQGRTGRSTGSGAPRQGEQLLTMRISSPGRIRPPPRWIPSCKAQGSSRAPPPPRIAHEQGNPRPVCSKPQIQQTCPLPCQGRERVPSLFGSLPPTHTHRHRGGSLPGICSGWGTGDLQRPPWPRLSLPPGSCVASTGGVHSSAERALHRLDGGLLGRVCSEARTREEALL